MPTLKVRCPECEAAIRQPIDPVDEPTDFTVTCPKCDYRFLATAEPEIPVAQVATNKPAKPTRSRDDDDDDDETPRKNRKKAAAGTNTKLIAAGVGGGL